MIKNQFDIFNHFSFHYSTHFLDVNKRINQAVMNRASNGTLQFHINHNKQLLILLFSVLFFMMWGCSGSTDPNSENDTDQNQEPEEVTVTEEEAVDALIQVIQDSGLEFPSREGASKNKSADFGLFAMDYIELGTSQGGLIEIKLWVGNEGNIIPKPSWQAANQNVCLRQGRNMKGAVKQLEFTILTPSQEVQLHYIDIETGKIEQSVVGTQNEGDSDSSNWLTESMSDAWSQMQNKVTIGGTVGPCGDKIELQIQFVSKITSDFTENKEEPAVYYEHIQASFPLTFDDDKKAFTGTGDLEWLAYKLNGEPGGPPTGKSLEVVRLVTPWIDNPIYDESTLELELPGFEDGTPLINVSWPLIHKYEINEEGDNYVYIITGWQENPDDASVVMTKTFNRTESFTVDGDPVTVTEHTTIEITR